MDSECLMVVGLDFNGNLVGGIINMVGVYFYLWYDVFKSGVEYFDWVFMGFVFDDVKGIVNDVFCS